MVSSGSPPTVAMENSASPEADGFFPMKKMRFPSGDQAAGYAQSLVRVSCVATDELKYRRKTCGLPATVPAYATPLPSGDQTGENCPSGSMAKGVKRYREKSGPPPCLNTSQAHATSNANSAPATIFQPRCEGAVLMGATVPVV